MVRLKLIPDGWEARHAAVLTGSRTATVDIYSPPPDGELWVYDAALEQTVPARGPLLHRQQQARVQRLREEGTAPAGGQTATVQRHLVALDRDIDGVGVGCQIDVTASTDPDLTGQTLHVVDELRGSLRFERHLLALDHLTP